MTQNAILKEHRKNERLERVLAAHMSRKNISQLELARRVYEPLGYASSASARELIGPYCMGLLFGTTSSHPHRSRRESAPYNLAVILHAVGIRPNNYLVAEVTAIFAAYDLPFSYPPPQTPQP